MPMRGIAAEAVDLLGDRHGQAAHDIGRRRPAVAGSGLACQLRHDTRPSRQDGRHHGQGSRHDRFEPTAQTGRDFCGGMAAIEHRTVDLVDDLDDRQVAGENRRECRVFTCSSVEQRAEIQPGRTVRIARGAREIDDHIGRAGAGLRLFRIDLQPVGAAVPAFTQHHALELEQGVEPRGPWLRRCSQRDLNRNVPAVDRQRLAVHPPPRMVTFAAKLDDHVEPTYSNASAQTTRLRI